MIPTVDSTVSYPTVASMVLLAILLLPLPALGQVCLGSPTESGQFSLVGDANITERSNDFGVGVEYNAPGPIGLRAGVALEEDTNDDRVARFDGRISYTVYANQVSVCPVTGADYTSRTTDGLSETRIRVPLGLSVGGRLKLSDDGPALIPSVRAGINHRRFSGEAFEDTFTDNSAFVIGGGSVSLNEFSIRGEAGIDSAEDVDPFYRLSFGVRF